MRWRTIPQLIAEAAERGGEATFLHYRQRRISFRELHLRSNAVANALLELGLRRGDKLGLLLPNCPKFLYAWFGASKAGIVSVPINTQLKPHEAAQLLRHCCATAAPRPWSSRRGWRAMPTC